MNGDFVLLPEPAIVGAIVGLLYAQRQPYNFRVKAEVIVMVGREAGKLRSEGKDYVVHDGDVMHFRFNV